MDNVNFSTENIEIYYNEVVESVYKLHENSVMNQITKENDAKLDNEQQQSMATNTCAEDDLNNIEGLDEYTKFIMRQLKNKGKINNTVGSNEDTVNTEKMLEEFLEKVKKQLKYYRDFWTNDKLNMVTILDEFGNERYKMDKKRNKINYNMITLVNDASYVGKYFDVMSWWKLNSKLYPELSVRACIVLGKPTHNGFQERVFSRGTYQDTKLKKRLKEENFEMSVLNAINNRKVQDLKGIMDLGLESLLNEISDADKEIVQEQQVREIKDFFEKGDITEEEDGKPKADDGKQKVEDGKQKADDGSDGTTLQKNDDNDSDSVYSSCSEIFGVDGDDDLSIAQMCQMLHIPDDESDSFELS
jgi:hypothetical protein